MDVKIRFKLYRRLGALLRPRKQLSSQEFEEAKRILLDLTGPVYAHGDPTPLPKLEDRGSEMILIAKRVLGLE
jgi:hypothetical protein